MISKFNYWYYNKLPLKLKNESFKMVTQLNQKINNLINKRI